MALLLRPLLALPQPILLRPAIVAAAAPWDSAISASAPSRTAPLRPAPPCRPVLAGRAALPERPRREATLWRPRGLSSGVENALVSISEARIREFLKAEVNYFATQAPNSMTLREVLDASTPEKAAELCLAQLPIRFAQRILQIEKLQGWRSIPELLEVHRLYSETFRDLRLMELDVNNLDNFTGVVQMLKNRMKNVIALLAVAMRTLQNKGVLSEAKIGQWLDTFLLSRIGTEMLTSQYVACTAPDGKRKGRQGIVDDACDPASICEQAARHARKLVKMHFSEDQDIEIRVESVSNGSIGDLGRVRFPYVPQYLFYIMVELLKNSARATVESCGGDPAQIKNRPIVITVGADPNEVAIRVLDEAGGIPFSVRDRVWSYLYSTAAKTKGGSDFSQQGTPLAGYGVGLPLSRLYARYLGGSLHLQSLPNVGTSAYLYLKRLETEAREELPTDFSRASDVAPFMR